MIRKVFSLLPLVMMAFGFAKAQDRHLPCTTTEVNESYKQSFPEIAAYEQQLKAFIDEAMKNINVDRANYKGTELDPNKVLHIPVVVHVVHDYGNTDWVSDNDIFRLMDEINTVYMKRNADTTQVIAPFKKYIGNPNIMFHLATKDPQGRPTTGITRHRSYLTGGGDDQAKFDQWDPTSYLNIWSIARIGRGISNGVVAAYAVFPSSAGAFPYTDGIITSAGSIFSNKTIPHEIGHILNLYHTWGNIPVATRCGETDEIDDTPPTTGHFSDGQPFGNTANGRCDAASLYDTSCTNNLQSLAKILLDKNSAPAVDFGQKGFDYFPGTNLVLESVKIYPSVIGGEFEITNYKQNRITGVFEPINVFGTKRDSLLGKSMLGTNVVANNFGVDSPVAKTSIVFNALKHIWIDSFDIYPSTIGDTFTIALRKFNGDLIKSVTGVTSTNTGAQTVPFGAFIPNATNYRLQIVRNPGLYCDSLVPATRAAIDASITGALEFVTFVDTTGFDNSTSPTAYKGRYNFFYNWKTRFDALTTTADSFQVVKLGYKVTPDTNYRLTLTKNPGVYNDSVGNTPYVKSIPCVIDITNDVTAGRYDLLYDLSVRYGYIKDCIDYPDTVNTQNIMDYADCPIMFTHQQVARMRATLQSNVGGRNRLVNDTTHIRTGILDEFGGTYGKRIDLKPVPDISVERSGLNVDRSVFLCTGSEFRFRQRSWRDTIEAVEMSFNKNASQPTITQTGFGLSSTVSNTFNEPGWVNVTVKATGNNTGDSTIEFKNVVYVADGNSKIDPNNGFFMEFDEADQNNPLEKWPIFNYYGNYNKWFVDQNVGYWDKSCIVYQNYDKRSGPESYNGTPKGDVDDFFTPAFDLSNMQSGECRLNFMSSGAFRTSDERLLRDTLSIAYSTDCGANWVTMARLMKSDLGNKGLVPIEYAPLYYGDWALKSFDIPAAARTNQVFFRFRFNPGVDDLTGTGLNARVLPGTGNNFFIDRLNISSFKLGVNTLLTGDKNVAIAPNPTHGGSQLIIRSALKDDAKVIVTDIAGKVVYTTQQKLNGTITTIEIPASAIQVKGVYMVHIMAGYERYTEKLVSY